jgi:hypothetical protein
MKRTDLRKWRPTREGWQRSAVPAIATIRFTRKLRSNGQIPSAFLSLRSSHRLAFVIFPFFGRLRCD